MNTASNKTENQNDSSESSVHSIIRLVHFVIDTVVWFTLYLTVAYIFDLYFFRFSSYVVNYIYSIALGLILYLAYYAVLEFYFHKTLGKFLTRTKVINRDGGEITFSTIFKRTISRLIPIDIFYYLFSRRGLHDRLSNTGVMKSNSEKI